MNIPGVNFIHSDKFDVDISSLPIFDVVIDFTLFTEDDIRFAKLLSSHTSYYFVISTSWNEYLYLDDLRCLLGISHDYLISKTLVENSLLAYAEKFIVFRLPPVVGGDIHRRLDWNSHILRTLSKSSKQDCYVDLLHPSQVCQILLAALNQVDQISSPIQEIGSEYLFTLCQWLKEMHAFQKNTNYHGKSIIFEAATHVINQSAYSRRKINSNFKHFPITPNHFLNSLL